MRTEEIEVVQHENDAFGFLAVACFETRQEEGEVFREAAETFAVRGIFQIKLRRDTLQRDLVICVEEPIQVHQDAVVVECRLGKEVEEDFLQNLNAEKIKFKQDER